ncbi:hypothetical protein IFM89_012857 [Coptis chinensis]|uniref:Uncharacterized protein n=1 Tax=Coptis chinensis TaxID=261450 RepID=A0A835HEH7_9MAGN|nr:hypothetical protein IFM89_012857 [Coptis chinensis]
MVTKVDCLNPVHSRFVVVPSSSAFINTTKPAASIGLETKTRSPPQETYNFFVDDEYSECSDGIDGSNCQDAFIFPIAPGSDGQDVQGSPIMKFREDTQKFRPYSFHFHRKPQKVSIRTVIR